MYICDNIKRWTPLFKMSRFAIVLQRHSPKWPVNKKLVTAPKAQNTAVFGMLLDKKKKFT